MRPPPPPRQDEPRSVNEADFLRICGLNTSPDRGRHVFEIMREEATAGIDRMTLTARSTPGAGAQQTNGRTVLASMLSESAIRNEIVRIWHFADSETKAVYERWNMGGDGDNWVIRWLLWQEILRRDGHHGAR